MGSVLSISAGILLGCWILLRMLDNAYRYGLSRGLRTGFDRGWDLATEEANKKLREGRAPFVLVTRDDRENELPIAEEYNG